MSPPLKRETFYLKTLLRMVERKSKNLESHELAQRHSPTSH